MRGTRKAFSVVRVPSEEEERERALSRQRGQLVRERQRLRAVVGGTIGYRRVVTSNPIWDRKAASTSRRTNACG